MTVTDAKDCAETSGHTITQPTAPLAIEETSITHVTCHGDATGSIEIEVSGGTKPYTYLWKKDGIVEASKTSKKADDLLAGVYTVTVTDAKDCAETSGHTIEESKALSISVVNKDYRCNSTSDGTVPGSIEVEVSGGTKPYTYLWKKDGDLLTYTDDSRTGLSAGTYSVTVKDANECIKTRGDIKISNNISFFDFYTDIDGDGYGDHNSLKSLCAPSSTHTVMNGNDKCPYNPYFKDVKPSTGYNCDGTSWYVDQEEKVQGGTIFDRQCFNSDAQNKKADCDGPGKDNNDIVKDPYYQDAWVVNYDLVVETFIYIKNNYLHYMSPKNIRDTKVAANSYVSDYSLNGYYDWELPTEEHISAIFELIREDYSDDIDYASELGLTFGTAFWTASGKHCNIYLNGDPVDCFSPSSYGKWSAFVIPVRKMDPK